MISIQQTILVLDVVNRVISRPIILTMKARRKEQARNLKRRAKLEEPTFAWQDNDDSSSSSLSKEDEEANLCLMAKEEQKTSSVSSSISINFENYSQLFYAFKETHEEANRLALLNNRLKDVNN